MIIRNFLDKIACTRSLIGVVGDSMIDRYVPVIVDRVSPEFPNPITRRDQKRPIVELPGGAANVAAQFQNFNVEHRLITAYDDTAGNVFHKGNIQFEPLSYNFAGDRWDLSSGINPVKTRYYVDDFPYSRHDDEMDFEDWGDGMGCLPEHLNELPEWLTWPDFDCLIISDYHKGFFHTNNWPELWTKRSSLTIVDPKKNPIDRWKGCTVFKPNSVEAGLLSGKKHWDLQADYFLKTLECEHVVITQGGSGVVGKSRDGSRFEYRPVLGIPPRSVIGAGDCFVAFLAMALTLKFSIDQCAEIAFIAGAAYVKDIHNKPITPHQLLRQANPTMAKSLLPYKPRDFKLVFTNGCFDLFHTGHLETLRYAKTKGDKLVVALNSDESISRLKGPNRPLVPLNRRMELVAALECVDFVCHFDENSPAELIHRLDPEVIVKGADYTGKEVVGGEGREVHLAPLVDGVSTTKLLGLISPSA